MTDQTQTTTEPVAWRVRPKGALGDVMGFQIVTNRYVAQDYSEQPAFEVQPLYTTPQPLAIGLDREAVARRIYENRPAKIIHPENRVITWDEAPELVPDRIAQIYRDTDAILALAAPAEGYVLVPVEKLESILLDITQGTPGYARRKLEVMIPAAPTGGRS